MAQSISVPSGGFSSGSFPMRSAKRLRIPAALSSASNGVMAPTNGHNGVGVHSSSSYTSSLSGVSSGAQPPPKPQQPNGAHLHAVSCLVDLWQRSAA